jgi:hypothetical protein
MVSISPESITSGQVDYQIPVMRSSENQLTAIQQAFLEGDFRSVTVLSESSSQYNPEVTFLTGLAYLKLGELKNAEAALLKVETSNQQNQTNEFSDQVDYYLVQVYLSNNQIELAEERIQKIMADDQHTYHANFGKLDLIKLTILKFKD